jgi:hypothetical protein
MGCSGVIILIVGALITLIAGLGCLPLGLLGIFLMWLGWKLIVSDIAPSDRKAPPKPKDPKIML